MDRGFFYDQRTGDIWLVNGGYELPLGTGFAGLEDGRNNPAMEQVKSYGPLPRGEYEMRIVEHKRFRAPAIALTPEKETETFGRSGFYIHGGTKSHGCIVINGALRRAIAELVEVGYRLLKVV